MQDLRTKTISEIAVEMPISTRVFEEFKIDYCCGGRKPFVEACESAGVNSDVVIAQIDKLFEKDTKDEFSKLNDVSLTELINYICDKHHTFTRQEIGSLIPLAAKVANRHGENHSELLEVEKLFGELSDDLLQHLLKEENVLFPYIEKLERVRNDSAALPLSCFGTVNNPIRMMMMEHDTAGDILKQMRVLTNDYNLPEGACLSYIALFKRLEEFEKDLHKHIHLENNLLFPRAIELEDEVLK